MSSALMPPICNGMQQRFFHWEKFTLPQLCIFRWGKYILQQLVAAKNHISYCESQSEAMPATYPFLSLALFLKKILL
jgi:hypothetical protein